MDCTVMTSGCIFMLAKRGFGCCSASKCKIFTAKCGQIISSAPHYPIGETVKTIRKSAKLANVCYDIRGPIMDAARQMEEEGHKIIKLNIGNLAVFGFDAPEEIQQDMIRNLPN